MAVTKCPTLTAVKRHASATVTKYAPQAAFTKSPFTAALQEIASPVAVKDFASDSDEPSAPVVFNEPWSDAFYAVHSISSVDYPEHPFKLPTKVKKGGRPKKSKYISRKRAKNEDSTESYLKSLMKDGLVHVVLRGELLGDVYIIIERPWRVPSMSFSV